MHANDGIEWLTHDPAGNIYAAGWFTNGPTNQVGNPYIAKFDGTSWSDITTNSNLDTIVLQGSWGTWIQDLSTDRFGNIYCEMTLSSGHYGILKFDGTSWSSLPLPPAFFYNANWPYTAYGTFGHQLLFDHDNNLYVGYTECDSANSCHLFPFMYNGTAWSLFGDTATFPLKNQMGFTWMAMDNADNIYFLSGSYDTVTCPSSPYAGQLVIKYTQPTGVHGVNVYHPVNVYPNPASDLLHVYANSNMEQLEVTDITGKLVYSKSNNQKQTEIDVSDFANGLYFCRISTGNDSYIKKFVVLH